MSRFEDYEFPTYPLQTVEDLQDISRRTINRLHEDLNSARYERDQAQREEKSRGKLALKYEQELEEKDTSLKAKDAKIAKLQGVIEALKLDLGNEREAHTKTRESKEQR